jgi:signal transduction histidine kinase
VRQIALAHRGSATCRPRDGGGTIFEVVLRSATSGEADSSPAP